MNRVSPPESDEGWLGWRPSQTQRKQAERLLTDRAVLGNPLLGMRFASPVLAWLLLRARAGGKIKP